MREKDTHSVREKDTHSVSHKNTHQEYTYIMRERAIHIDTARESDAHIDTEVCDARVSGSARDKERDRGREK